MEAVNLAVSMFGLGTVFGVVLLVAAEGVVSRAMWRRSVRRGPNPFTIHPPETSISCSPEALESLLTRREL